MNRYEEVTSDVSNILSKIQAVHFPELKNAKIKALFDIKKRLSKRAVILACIVKPNDLIRHFSKIELNAGYDGYDYIIILDKVCWDAISDTDKERIIRHELRHTFFDIESEGNSYQLIDHDVTDFYSEMELNNDDPRWRQRLATLTNDIYEQAKEAAQEIKGGKKRGKSNG